MKTKRENMSAKFTKELSNAKNYSGDKETISRFCIVDKKTEKTVVDCRLYMGRSASASAVYCALWVTLTEAKKPMDWSYPGTSGRGQASGYGYHKQSAAVQDALSSAGIQLYGSPYNHKEETKTRAQAHIGGCGDRAIEDALLAVAYAAGFTDCIFLSI